MTQQQNKLIVNDFSKVEKHYTKEEFLDIMIDIMKNTVIKNNFNFDMCDWGYFDRYKYSGDSLQFSNPNEYESFEDYQKRIHNCGTSCCMLGWAASDQRLTSKGLFLDEDYMLRVLEGGNIEYAHFYTRLPNITGLSEQELYMLFGSDKYERSTVFDSVFNYEKTFIINKFSHLSGDDESTPEDALEFLKWYRSYIENPSKALQAFQS